MNNSVCDIFLSLKGSNTAENDKFSAKPLPFNPNHKIGIDSNDYPLFFVEYVDFGVVPDIDLELMSVQFNQLYRLTNKEETSEGHYTIISLKTINPDSLRYFIDVTSLILQRMNKRPGHKEITSELSKLIELFKVLSKPSGKTTQDLWAELFVIEQAKDLVYMLQSWRISPEDRYDSNDGNDRVEVKCAVDSQREHRFSYEQLTPGTRSQTLIASAITTRSGKGKNVFDLKDSVLRKVQDLKLHLILNEVIASTPGTDFDKASEYYFDYQMAIDSLSFFDVNEIPNIPSDVTPSELLNIKFDCDLTRIEVASKGTDPILSTILFSSIGL